MIDRRTIFTEAWKSAKRTAGQYRTIRCAFAAALRRVWSLVKAVVPAPQIGGPGWFANSGESKAARPWASENIHRAHAVARADQRLGSYVIHSW